MSLRIIVAVKHVPDATGDRRFAEDGTTDRASVDALLSELDEYAVEQALRIAEAHGDAQVTALTIGPEAAMDALRKALSMGADDAMHVNDESIHGTDAIGTSLILARAVERTGFDLVVCGMASTDGAMGVIPALLAERLGVPQLTMLSEVTVDGDTVRGRRDSDAATEQLESRLPAVVSVTDQSGEVRYPNFKGILAAKKKPVAGLGLHELGIEAEAVGLEGAWSAVNQIVARPPRVAGTIVRDEGDGGGRLAAFLAAQKFI